VVDLGAGTGQFSLAVAPSCQWVVAVDSSPVMQEALRQKVAASGGHRNVECVSAGLLTYEHSGEPGRFRIFPVRAASPSRFRKALALARLAHVMRPGAVLRLWDVVYRFQPQEAAERIESWCATGATSAETGWSRAELEEHVPDEHSTFVWLLEPMIERSGFRIDDAVCSADGIVARYVGRRRHESPIQRLPTEAEPGPPGGSH